MSAQWLAISFLVGVVATWAVRRVARALGFVNHPNPIVPQHRVPVAYAGGVAIALTMLVVTWVARTTDSAGAALIPARVWVPATLFLVIGTCDDLRPLHPIAKLVLQGAGAVSAIALGLVWRVTGVGVVDAALSFGWFLLLVNAFNVTDVCDGLVAGLAVIVLAFAGARAADGWVALVTVGAVLGFLVFNRPPASIFLGDGGSHLLGFLAGAVLVTASPAAPAASWKHVAAAVIAAGVVLLEVALLVYSRARAGIPWWRGSPHHFSLRLQARGFSRLQTDLLAWASAAALGVTAWFLPRLADQFAVALALVVVLALAVSCRVLLRWEVRR